MQMKYYYSEAFLQLCGIAVDPFFDCCDLKIDLKTFILQSDPGTIGKETICQEFSFLRQSVEDLWCGQTDT